VNRKERRLLIAIIALAIALIVAFLFVQTEAAASWTASYQGSGLSLKVSGRTELVGADGSPIQLRFLAKMMMLPLSFVYQGQKVASMRVSFTWTVSGLDVNWDTLTVTVEATGTGSYRQTASFKNRAEGSYVFTLPLTVQQLGRTPSANETVTWTMEITLQAWALSSKGETLTAKSMPIKSTVTTVWQADSQSFEPETSPSTEYETGTGTATVGGGCGPPGYHLVWVYGVQPKPWLETYALPTLTVMAIAAGSLASALVADYTIFLLVKGRKPENGGKRQSV
jgi:FlaG/FlaF family flagellin (archaellin)